MELVGLSTPWTAVFDADFLGFGVGRWWRLVVLGLVVAGPRHRRTAALGEGFQAENAATTLDTLCRSWRMPRPPDPQLRLGRLAGRLTWVKRSQAPIRCALRGGRNRAVRRAASGVGRRHRIEDRRAIIAVGNRWSASG